MHPILLSLGPITIHTYGFLIALGFVLAVEVIRRLAIRSELNPEKMVEFCYGLLFIGFLGARLLYIITRWSEFASDPIAILKVWEGGLVFLGGPIADIPYLFWIFRKSRLPVWKSLDVFAPGLVLAHSVGRLGCLAAGCCYGKPTESFFGIKLYSELVEPYLRGIPLHPTQLYESFSLFILFLGLIWIHRKKLFDGQVALAYLLIYPMIRSIIEVFRGDQIRGFVIDDVLSTSQFISIFIFLGAGIALWRRLNEIRATDSSRFNTQSTSAKKG
jgi:phosphatidylglycerol:prolipoprotein diacylglycerol transferase